MSHDQREKPAPGAHMDRVVRMSGGGDVAVECDRRQPNEAIGEARLQRDKLPVDVSEAHLAGAPQQVCVQLLRLPVHLGLASRPYQALNDGQSGDHAADPRNGFGVSCHASGDGGTTTSQASKPERGVKALVQALVEPVEHAAVLDVQDGLVGGSFVGSAGSGLDHVSPFGFTGGGGLRDGGTCDRPSPFSMGGPFNTLVGVGTPIVAKQDRPPTLVELLGSLEGQTQQLKRAAFVTRLARMDWSFEHTEDGRVYRKGVAELAALRLEQLDTDPSGQLWNKHVPQIYRTDRRLKVAIQLASGGYESTWVVSSLPIVDVARHFMDRHDGARVEVSAVAEAREVL